MYWCKVWLGIRGEKIKYCFLISIRNSKIIYRGENVNSSWNVSVCRQNRFIQSICSVVQILEIFNGKFFQGNDILNCFGDRGCAIDFFCGNDKIFPFYQKLQFLFQSAKKKTVFSVFDLCFWAVPQRLKG